MKTKNTTKLEHCKVLEGELAIRTSKNARYSHRAFARDLGITPGYLSQILSGKRFPKFERALEMAQRLGWSKKKAREFVELIQRAQVRKTDTLTMLEESNESSYQQLDSDQFELISNWYHFAIVELTTLKGFNSNPKWIASRLNISIQEVRQAIERLIRVGLLKTQDQKLVKTHKKYVFSSTPSKAIRSGHVQRFELAKKALEEQASSEREFVGLTLGIKHENIPLAKQLIDKFYLEFTDLMEETPSDAVYQLTVGFFRADTGTSKN